MTKYEFVEELRRRGYEAENENGCVMVIGPDRETIRSMEQIAAEVGYQGSYGWRWRDEQKGGVAGCH